MFAKLRQLLTVVTTIILINNNSYSQTSIFSNSLPNSLVTCGGPDTVQVVISSVNGINSLHLSANPSPDFPIASILSNPNISIVDTSNINITAFDGELNSTSCSFDLMIDCRVNASIPQIFSPNGDRLNDVLYTFGRNFTLFEFVLFNRWGEKIFETNDPIIGWGENFKGKAAQAIVYIYYLSAVTEQFGEIRKKGDITLIR